MSTQLIADLRRKLSAAHASSAYALPPNGSPLLANQVPTLNVCPKRVASHSGNPTEPSDSDPEDKENSGSDEDEWGRCRSRYP